MKKTIAIYMLILTSVALSASALLVFRTNATTSNANEWQLKKYRTAVSCGIGRLSFSKQNRSDLPRNKLPGSDHDGNGCLHQFAGSLCRLHESKKKQQMLYIA